ncbi:MAG: hypothetical protein JXR88_15315 [Clostridia bacterium]|nr:hypothetical protein [Clostridia bacterium]
MKNFIIGLFAIISILLVSCEEKQISVTEYGNQYVAMMNELNISIHEGVMKESVDMMDTQQFRVVYSHEDFIHYYDELIKTIDNILYEFSKIGPQLSDVTLMKYQSKIEDNLFHIMTTMKQYRDLQNFNTNAVNSFSFYEDIYNLMKDTADEVLALARHQLILETYLEEQDFALDSDYVMNKYNNLQGYSYMYLVISSKLSSYQDYSGLQVNPRFPVLITNNEGDIYLTSELDFNVMLNTVEDVGELLRCLSDIDLNSKISFENSRWINQFLTETIHAYEAYANIRSEYSYDFFKSGEFREYQVIVDGEQTILGGDPGTLVYSFDSTTEEGAKLLEMQDYFYYLVFLLDSTHHGEMMHANH